MAPILQSPNDNLAPILQSPNAILAPILQSPNVILALILQSPNAILATISKSPILLWQLFTKILQKLKNPSAILGNTLSKAQILVWQNSTNTKSPSTILGNILSEAQIVVWHLFYKAQILIWHYFYKAQNAILAPTFTKPKYNFGKNYYIMLKGPIISLAKLFKYQKPKYYPWQYFIKSPNTSLTKFYIMLKAQS